jgi:hypothetical protein
MPSDQKDGMFVVGIYTSRLEAFRKDDQVIARFVKIADAGFQLVTGCQVEFSRRLEVRFAGGFGDEQSSTAAAADAIFHFFEQTLPDALTVRFLCYANPVQVIRSFGQRALAIAGKAEQLSFPAGSEEMIPTLRVAFGGKLGPQFFDGGDVVRFEQLDAAG